MNLRGRDTLKPPKRYDEENFTKPAPPPPARNESRSYKPDFGRPVFPPPFVDFNPNLPPAAFPTIDTQQPPKCPAQEAPQSSRDRIGSMQERSGANYFGHENITNCQCNASRERGMAGKGEVSMVDVGDDFSSSVPGKLNLQVSCDCVNYPNELENSEHGTRSSMNLSDDENDVGIGAYEAAGMSAGALQEIKWSDISPILQTEIFENLRSVCDYRQAVEALRLSPSEQIKMIEHSSARKEQVQRENAKLNEMRTKQLRALLRMDNSYLRTQKVPGQLVFRNISKKFLDTTAHSGPDYSMSQASDILIARKYLRSLGLDPMFAGEWSNNLVAITTTGMTGADEGFEWSGEFPVAEEANISEHGDTECESNPDSETATGASSHSDCSPPPKRLRTVDPSLNAAQHLLYHRRESSIPRAGTLRSLPFRTLSDKAESCQWRQPSRPFQNTFSQSSPLRRESVVRLKVGSQGAARIQQDIFGTPGDIMRGHSQPQMNISNDNTSVANMLPQLWPRHAISGKRGSCKTIKRSLGGTWIYSQSREDTEAASRASRMYRDGLAAARVEAKGALREDSACHQSSSVSPPTNLTPPNLGNPCQFEKPRMEPLARWTSSPGHSGNPRMIPNPGSNFVPHYMSLSNHTLSEGYGPQYSPITPPSFPARCEQEENKTLAGKLEGYAREPNDNQGGPRLLITTSNPTPNNAHMPGVATTTFCSQTTNAEGTCAKEVSLNAVQSLVSPVPELDMTEVKGESTVTFSGKDKHSSSPTETAVLPNVDTVLSCPNENPPDLPSAGLSGAISLGKMEGPRKKRNRRYGHGWTKKKKCPGKTVQLPTCVETTTEECTKKTMKRNTLGVDAANTRRRSERINKQEA
ncbi:lymphocyte-specific helicase, SNF2 family helicase/ATPase PasG [Histoplasma ohiense]|nr:lymphocyte-specific helicase, SNF2 family helicase/ATPase PasG [Histoplasma ohiense (nom. inval.)]